MKSISRSVWAVTLALIVILIGLFLVCAQRRTPVASSDDQNGNDEEFRQELLQLLDMTDEPSTTSSESDLLAEQDTPSAELADTTTFTPSDDEMLALLSDDAETPDETLETTPTTTPANMGLTPEMFAQVRTDVARLERVLERKSSTVDSLRNIIDNRNARLKDLETRYTDQRSTTKSKPKSEAAGSSAASSAFMEEYEGARGAFEKFRYQEAISRFQQLLAGNPNHKMADNCQYWIGECYYGLKDYQKAIVEFQKVFAYSETDKYDDAQLMIGLAYVRGGEKDKAQKEFESFLNSYNNSEYTSIAKRYYSNI